MIKKAFLFLAIVFFYGCSPIYRTPNFVNIASYHKTVAILPYWVEFNSKMVPKDASLEMIEQIRSKNTSMIRNYEVFFLNRKARRGLYSVTLQDTAITDSLLKKHNIIPRNLSKESIVNLAKILKVDAIITGEAYLEKIMSGGAAFALSVVTPFMVPSNHVEVKTEIYEGRSGTLIWSHHTKYTLNRSPEGLVKDDMRHIAKKFPYKKALWMQ